jgi:hypothetical protein
LGLINLTPILQNLLGNQVCPIIHLAKLHYSLNATTEIVIKYYAHCIASTIAQKLKELPNIGPQIETNATLTIANFYSNPIPTQPNSPEPIQIPSPDERNSQSPTHKVIPTTEQIKEEVACMVSLMEENMDKESNKESSDPTISANINIDIQ